MAPPSRSWYRRIIIPGLLLATLPPAASRAVEATSKQGWLDVNPSWQASQRVVVFGDAGVRGDFEDSRWWRLVLRPSLGAPVGPIRLTAGVGNFFTFTDLIDDRWEVRPFQGVWATWPNRRLALDHYLRLEERFDFNTDTWASVNSLRLRYQLQLSYRFSPRDVGESWVASVGAEAFTKLAGAEGLQREQFRMTAGVERIFTRARRVRFEVTWQQQTIFFQPDERFDVVYFRLRLYRRW